MGIYLNPGNRGFQFALNSEIYVDKTGMISVTNKKINSADRFICVSRPRRFGKSTAADMLTAYYTRGCDSREMFGRLKIAADKSFETHLNKYNVIRLNMTEFSFLRDIKEKINEIERVLLYDLIQEFPDIKFFDKTQLIRTLKDVYTRTGIPFIFIIDEWDCIFRESQNDTEAQRVYLDFLRNLLKDQSHVALAYMTGILPVKKYGVHSALNMFTEVSMTNPREYTEFTGFTEDEVRALCERFNMSFEETKRWYDGYNLKGISIYNPRSVVMSMTGGDYDNYWTQTESYEALKIYIQTNTYGVQDIVLKLLAGEEYQIDTTTFTNDMVTFESADDVLTLLVHLGYLTYNISEKTVRIPNHEIREQFISTVRIMGWSAVVDALRNSEKLLDATLACDEKRVAELLEIAHQENTSILKYNDENSLACVISLAYYSAKKSYSVYREMPAGKGFADMVFVPREGRSAPAIIVELKCSSSPESALKQIREKNYCEFLKNYTGEMLFVGINYDKDTKAHECKIEKAYK